MDLEEEETPWSPFPLSLCHVRKIKKTAIYKSGKASSPASQISRNLDFWTSRL
jgi:hypothetical protein